MRTLSLLALCWSLSSLAQAQDLTATTEAVDPPVEVSEAIRALLGSDATVVMRGANRIELWWAEALPYKDGAPAEPEWTNVAEGAIVGVLRNARVLSEIRGLPVKPGVYTLRYARQPQDGDHMGVSAHREFVLLSPAAADADARPAGYAGAVALSKRTLGRSHPAALAIDPLRTDAALRSVVANDLGHRAVVVEVPTDISGKPGPPIRFGLVLVGQVEH